MKQYLSPAMQVVHVQAVQQLMTTSSQQQAGPSADFMSNPDVSDVRGQLPAGHTVWDDDWSQD